MKLNPELYKPSVAKQAAFVLASIIGADISQSPDGKQKIVTLNTGRRVECTTWLAAYTVVHRIRKDQIEKK